MNQWQDEWTNSSGIRSLTRTCFRSYRNELHLVPKVYPAQESRTLSSVKVWFGSKPLRTAGSKPSATEGPMILRDIQIQFSGRVDLISVRVEQCRNNTTRDWTEWMEDTYEYSTNVHRRMTSHPLTPSKLTGSLRGALAAARFWIWVRNGCVTK